MNDNEGDDIEAQAAHWYARLNTLPLARETLEEFYVWQAGPGHSDAFDAVDRFHNRVGRLAARPAIVEATRRAYDRETAMPQTAKRYAPLAAAALVVLVAGASLISRWPIFGDTYTTGIGEQSVAILADGSKVALDTDTRLTVRFTDDARHVTLSRGQAYFTVAHNAARPFTVDAGGTRVVATGTQFDVRRDGAAVDVTLVQGGVRVTPADAPSTELHAGQQLRAAPDREPSVRTVDTASASAWTQGRVVLDNETLSEAVTEMNRYTRKPIILDAPRLADARIGGSFSIGDTSSFVTAVTASLPLKAQPQGDGSIRLTE